MSTDRIAWYRTDMMQFIGVAEGDGAIAVHTAARWFNGETLDAVNYRPKHIITQADVGNYMPAQW